MQDVAPEEHTVQTATSTLTKLAVLDTRKPRAPRDQDKCCMCVQDIAPEVHTVCVAPSALVKPVVHDTCKPHAPRDQDTWSMCVCAEYRARGAYRPGCNLDTG